MKPSLLIFTLGLVACVNPLVARAGAEVPPAVLDAEQERVQAIQQAVQAAVAVFAPDGNGGGSGVVITPDGYALSNFHVTSPVGNFLKCGMADGNLYDAVIVGVDPTGDVALIKLFGRDDFPTANMDDSDLVRVGDWCFAVGNPFLLATDFQPTVTYGIVSGVHRYQYPAGSLLEYADCIQTDAAINPGNSGGPLFNAQGNLIGINGRGSFEKRGRVNVGLGYAISINQIKNFLGHLRSGRIVDHATLGATVSSDETGRVLVSNILETSDAYRRGLRYGDQIVSFGERSIDSVNAFKNILGIYPRGWRVPLRFVRAGKSFEVQVRLAGVHAREALLEQIQGGRPSPKPDDPDRKPRPPMPLPTDHHETPASAPEHLKQFYVERPGYANYFFNLEHRDRVWDSFEKLGDFSSRPGTWSLVGTIAGGEEVRFDLGDDESAGSFPRGEVRIDAERDLTDQTGPPDSGGLLAALHLWRRLLVHGPEKFGQVNYLGTNPIPGREGLFDVLVATYNVAEVHFYFDGSSGQLVLAEMYPDGGVDPSEVYFEAYESLEDRYFPRQLIVRYGDAQFAEIELQRVNLMEGRQNET